MEGDRTLPARDESPEERIDRNLIELLNELRVALPGIQVLFAFLLVVPFNTGFDAVTEFQKGVYLVTLLAAALAAVCLIAPSIHHRIQFRRQDKEFVVVVGNRFAIAGLFLVALSICGAILLVVSYVFDDQLAEIVVIALGALFVVAWFAIPISRRIGGHAPHEDELAQRSRPEDY
jgi:amino acid transporter